MKKNAAKVIALVAAIAMVLSLAACGAKGGDSKVVYRTLDEIKESGTINIGVFSDKSPFGYAQPSNTF